MNVLLLIDADFASRERSMLRRVEVGLAGEGVSVLHVVPKAQRTEDPVLSARVVTFSPDRLGWTTRTRTRSFLSEIEAHNPAELAQGIDVVHVLGKRWWGFAAQAASEINAGLVVEIWRHASIDRASPLASRSRTALLASDPAIHRDMLKAGLGETARLAPWGVYATGEPNRLLVRDRAASLMVLGGRGDFASIDAALAGASRAIAGQDALVFVDARLAPKTHLWRSARNHGLLEKLSIIEDMEGQRELVLQGDMLILPCPDAENRSVVLDAMGHGMLVIAPRDPAIEILSDPSIAQLLPDPTPEAWAAAIASALNEPGRAREVGAKAWAFVRDRRRGAAHVASIFDTYEWLTSSDPIPFAN